MSKNTRTEWSFDSLSSVMKRFPNRLVADVNEHLKRKEIEWCLSGGGHLLIRVVDKPDLRTATISLTAPDYSLYHARIRTLLRKVTP